MAASGLQEKAGVLIWRGMAQAGVHRSSLKLEHASSRLPAFHALCLWSSESSPSPSKGAKISASTTAHVVFAH